MDISMLAEIEIEKEVAPTEEKAREMALQYAEVHQPTHDNKVIEVREDEDHFTVFIEMIYSPEDEEIQ